jgi:hypothetical protein
MQTETFQTIQADLLVTATGGQQQGLSTGDVLEAGGRATQAVLTGGRSLIGNVGQAYRQFNDPRVGNGFWDRAAYGFTGLFGIDPLKR